MLLVLFPDKFGLYLDFDEIKELLEAQNQNKRLGSVSASFAKVETCINIQNKNNGTILTCL